ncbi:MAG: hypothetical protein A2491_07040 [Bacteroidetes bacterium RIFOXYC12_FULL_35_7]|nr:MAG: hypothetical protein A2491_07040 [Bacteroidetes bacterium RIFOXYC12_FULL_35_7]
MQREFDITENEMLEALKKSGYLLESEISRILVESGFFIESNQVIEDPFTGKSREIDLMAEYHFYKKNRTNYQAASIIKFVFEIKNNLFPIVLLSKWEFSPNIEDWIGLKEALTIPNDLINLKYDWTESYYNQLILNNEKIFTQYCSFQKKKANDDLMALHPDHIHEGLSKITQVCEEMVKLWDKELLYDSPNKKENFFRHFLFMPILLINDELYELNDNKLNKVESSILVFNYYFNKESKMAYIFIVTKQGFPNFIKQMVKLENDVEEKMIKMKNNTQQ